MKYFIRIKNGIVVGTIEGELLGLQFSDDEDVEIFDKKDEFDSRIEELKSLEAQEPQPPTQEERLQALEDAFIALILGGM